MKRILTALGLFAVVGFLLGRTTGRPPAATANTSSTPIVQMQVPPPETNPWKDGSSPSGGGSPRIATSWTQP